MPPRRKASRAKGLKELSIPYPKRIADDLAKRYSALDSRAMELVEKHLLPVISKGGTEAEVKRAIRKIEGILAEEFSNEKIRKQAEPAAKQAIETHGKKFNTILGIAVGATIASGSKPPKKPGKIAFTPSGSIKGTLQTKVYVDPKLFAKEFVAENVKFIGDLRKGIRPGLEDAVVRSMQFGDSEPEELANRLRKIWAKNGVPSQLPTKSKRMLSTYNHARMVAHDQLSKLNANLNEARQRAAGIGSYIWTTQGDARVRPAHQALSGKQFAWNDPPSEGHPGTPPRCRCYSVAIVDRDQVIKNLVPLSTTSGR